MWSFGTNNQVRLVPAGWVPNPSLTGGNLPPQSLFISRDYWVSLGCPGTIEEFHQKASDLLIRSPRNA